MSPVRTAPVVAAEMVCVLGFVGGRTPTGDRIEVGGRRQAQLLSRLVAARGTTVSADDLVTALWPTERPKDPIAAIRTFVADIRRRLEPQRPRHLPSAYVVTDGRSYRLAHSARVDAWEFAEVAASVDGMPWAQRLSRLPGALNELWGGTPFGDHCHLPGVEAEHARLEELHARTVEALAQAQIDSGRGDLAIPELQLHVGRYPGRQRAWILLASALHSAGRTEEGLAVLGRARTRLVDQFGLDPSAELDRVQQDLLRGDAPSAPVWQPWPSTATELMPKGGRSRVLSSAVLLRDLAVSGADGLVTAQSERSTGAKELADRDDPRLTADFLTRLEIPGIWTISDDPARSARIVAASRRCLDILDGALSPAQRARLLALIGIESRGTRGPAGAEAANRAVAMARELGDPTVLGVALNAAFLQSFHTLDATDRRHAIGGELITLGTDHDLPTHQILGHLICLQTSTTAGDLGQADHHAATVDRLGDHHERSLAGFFTNWYRAIRADMTGRPAAEIQRHYDMALSLLPSCGMPGITRGLAPLVGLVRALRAGSAIGTFDDVDFGPNAPWTTPVTAYAAGDHRRASTALRQAPAPPPDHLATTRWALLSIAAHQLGDNTTAAAADGRIRHLPHPIGSETGMFTLGDPGQLPVVVRTA